MNELDRLKGFRAELPAYAHDDDERARTVLREHIASAPARPRRRPSVRRLTLAGGAGAALLAGGVALALVIPSGGAGPTVVERAAAALAHKPGTILYIGKTTTVPGVPQAGPFETWTLQEPPYTSRTAWRDERGVHELESTNTVDLAWGYGESTNTVRPINSPQVSPPVTGTLPPPNELDVPRQLLESDRMVNAGAVEIDGRRLYKLEQTEAQRSANPVLTAPDGQGWMVFYVDPETFLPVYEDSTVPALTDPGASGETIIPAGPDGAPGVQTMTLRTRYDIQWLPDTPDNRKLLSIRAQHPDAPIGPPTDDPDEAQGVGG